MRPYEPARDFEAVLSIWNEINWLDDCTKKEEGLRAFLRETQGVVGEHAGRVEGHAGTRRGVVLHEGRWLPLALVSSVTTSPIFRVGGFATRGTAAVLADAAESGAVVGSLGMFDQGFYDRLGFGTGVYDHRMTIDPRTLKVPRLTRRPVRLGLEDLERVHAARRRSWRSHGAAAFDGTGDTEADMLWYAGGYVLGFEADDGDLSHCVSVVRKGESGPDRVRWFAFQTREQLHELLSVLKSLADSLYALRIADPPGVQLQDLIDRPFESAAKRKGGSFHNPDLSSAWDQWRILQPEAAFEGARAAGPLSFVVDLVDPIEQHLEERPWRGLSGRWTVELGERCAMHRGGAEPGLRASVGAFSRWWLGVRPASHLALTDDFDASGALIEDLDRAWRPPAPRNDWEF